jgi:nicotinamide phosphoribosyltransferase
MNKENLVLMTDGYKLCHWNQYPHDTQGVYSYFESRKGATFPSTVFFGLQHIIKQFLLKPVCREDVMKAKWIARSYFGNDALFNEQGWNHILTAHNGYLPLRIKAVPEGSVIPTGNVLMTVENTDPACYWLTNAMESLLTHVWYPSTVASLSYHTKLMLKAYLEKTADSEAGLPFMLHDFGYRGAATNDAAAIGGAAHLINFKGTDTLTPIILAMHDYGAELEGLAASVPATEHSVMTSLGREGEMDVVKQVMDENPAGIVSVVADSYDIYHFVNTVTTNQFREAIEARDGVFVIRPDSVTTKDDTPEKLVRWIAKTVDFNMGSTVNSKGYKVLNPKVRILWGDGIDPIGIDKILSMLEQAGFSAENMVFGMGGGLLQKVNRDTQRFAFKASAQKRGGTWHDVFKSPLDASKVSKKGRLMLTHVGNDEYHTVVEYLEGAGPDFLETVFENGKLVREQTFDDIRERAAIPTAVAV